MYNTYTKIRGSNKGRWPSLAQGARLLTSKSRVQIPLDPFFSVLEFLKFALSINEI